MATGYIPKKESLFVTWAANFTALIVATPTAYGLAAGDATAIAAVNTPYQAAYLVAKNPTTRTPTTIATKDTDRASALAVMRPYSVLISRNAGVSPALKIGLGVNPGTSVPTPVTTPTTYPILSNPSSVVGGLVIRYRDELASPSVKAKPAGATAVIMRSTTTSTGSPAASIDLWPGVEIHTKSPFIKDTSALTSGQTIWLAGQWVTRTGLVGGYGPIISATIPL